MEMGVDVLPFFLEKLSSERSVRRNENRSVNVINWRGTIQLKRTVILDGARTAFGPFGGALSALSASDGGIAIKEGINTGAM